VAAGKTTHPAAGFGCGACEPHLQAAVQENKQYHFI